MGRRLVQTSVGIKSHLMDVETTTKGRDKSGIAPEREDDVSPGIDWKA